jgi:hypothetical protein
VGTASKDRRKSVKNDEDQRWRLAAIRIGIPLRGGAPKTTVLNYLQSLFDRDVTAL